MNKLRDISIYNVNDWTEVTIGDPAEIEEILKISGSGQVVKIEKLIVR